MTQFDRNYALDRERLAGLVHYLLDAKHPPRGLAPQFDAAYEFWHRVWSETFEQVGHFEPLFSDAFLRHDEVSVIFSNQTPIGLVTYDRFDLRRVSHRAHSYFKHYPTRSLEALCQSTRGPVMVMGFLTVHHDWRKSKIGPCISDALIGLATRRFLNSDANALIAFTRNDRKTDELVYRFGAQTIASGLMAYGIPSDVISITRESLADSPVTGIDELVDFLWDERRDRANLAAEPIRHLPNRLLDLPFEEEDLERKASGVRIRALGRQQQLARAEGEG